MRRIWGELFARDANTAHLGAVGERFFSTVSSNLIAIAQASAELAGETVVDPVPGGAGLDAPGFPEDRAALLIVDDSAENRRQIAALLVLPH